MTIRNPKPSKSLNRQNGGQRPFLYGAWLGHSPKWLAAIMILLVLLALIPLLGVFWNAFGDSSGVWPHLLKYVLPQSITTTLILLSGIGLLVLLFGSTTAWMVSRYQFPLRNHLQWALVLPLAIPTYLVAYVYGEFLDFTGPVQSFLRYILGATNAREYWFPDIRSTGGAILLMSLVLYPYVYLPARLSFQMQNTALLDVGRVLGAGPFKLFWRVGLPAARPAIAVGVMLVLMEALNDIGAVEYLGVRTLTFSVYDTWLNRSSLAGASQIALILLAVVALLVHLEQRMRKRQRFSDTKAKTAAHSPIVLTGYKGLLASIWCLLPIILGFAIPLGQMLSFATRRFEQIFQPELFAAALNSVLVAVSTALVCTASAFLIVYSSRRAGTEKLYYLRRIATLGYAIPGTILAIGTLSVIAAFDNTLDSFLFSNFGIHSGLLISGSMAILVYACSVRFLTIAVGTVESGYAKISVNLASASRTLGRSEFQTLREIDIPLLKRAFGTAALLITVDTMKELSATLLLRPFNFNTLATYIYERASRALFEDATIAALLIVLIGLIPVYLLTKVIVSEHYQS